MSSTTRVTTDLTTRSAAQLLRSPRLWGLPTLVVLVLTAALAALYLGGSINSSRSLEGFPVAVVDTDAGADLPDGTRLTAGDTVARSLVAGIDAEKFDVAELTLAEAESRMETGSLYGAVVLPEDFSASLVALAGSTTSATATDKPVVTILTNPRAGTATPGIVTTLMNGALEQVSQDVGAQLLGTTTDRLRAAGQEAALTGAAAQTLAAPIIVHIESHQPLPDGTGGGLSAFYYALLLVLAGFTGSMVVSTLIDGTLGFVPSEFGPVYVLSRHSGLSRTATLVVKWVVMAGLAVTVSALYLAVSRALGMPVDHPVQLWLFSAAGIFAVSLVAQAVLAIFGSVGLLVNLFVFVMLALPSAGGTIPLEATPPFFRWLGSFEPLHQLYLGTRSVLYYDASLESGLGRALVACAISSVVGIVVGLLVTRTYDRKGMWRGRTEPLHLAPAA